jgi:hypothetical protein
MRNRLFWSTAIPRYFLFENQGMFVQRLYIRAGKILRELTAMLAMPI